MDGVADVVEKDTKCHATYLSLFTTYLSFFTTYLSLFTTYLSLNPRHLDGVADVVEKDTKCHALFARLCGFFFHPLLHIHTNMQVYINTHIHVLYMAKMPCALRPPLPVPLQIGSKDR